MKSDEPEETEFVVVGKVRAAKNSEVAGAFWRQLAFRFSCNLESLIHSPGRRLRSTLGATTQRDNLNSTDSPRSSPQTAVLTMTHLSFVTTTNL